MFKGIFFDIDDTIFDYRKSSKEALISLCESRKIEYRKEYLITYRKLDEILWDRQKKGQMTVEDVISKRAYEMGKILNLKEESFIKAFNDELSETIDFVDGAYVLIKDVYKKGYRIYGASNGFLDSQVKRLKKANIYQYFTDVYVSDDIGFNKPDERFFIESLSRASLDKKDVLMVGDSYRTDILGAMNAGIKACFFNPNRKIVDKDVKEIYSLYDLMDIL